jgi:cytidylate kinase
MKGIPVIAIDGPSASGKGTLASRVAQTLGYHYLDSGALYRLTALWIQRQGLTAESHENDLARQAACLPACFVGDQVLLDGRSVTEEMRSEACGMMASHISVFPALRAALLDRQRQYRQWPGLVADGRDMGSVVFPDAVVKVFLTAGVDVRAKRRYNQLIAKGNHVKMEKVLQDLLNRDEQDRTRQASPLDSTGYQELDTTVLTIDEGVAAVLGWCRMALGGTT